MGRFASYAWLSVVSVKIKVIVLAVKMAMNYSKMDPV